MALLDFLLTLAAFGVALPAGVLLGEVLAACAPPTGGRAAAREGVPRPPVAVLIPAHDEEAGLGDALQTVIAQCGPGDQVLVVADNCSDRTEEIARAKGVRVVRRTDAERAGKGHALRFGFAALADERPELVVVLDADCRLEPGALDALARAAARTGRPCQGVYLMEPPGSGDRFSSLSQLAVLLKNQVRPLGLHRLGLPCQLAGSGMALPWSAVEAVQPDGESVVEDMQMSVDLTRAGLAPRFAPDARLTAPLPTGRRAALAQRRRWEHGHVHTLLVEGPRLLARGLAGGGRDATALALDLMVPPISLLVGVIALVLAAAALGAWLGGAWLPVEIAAGAFGAVLVAVLAGWWRFARRRIRARDLAAAPFYALRKLPLYLSFPVRRERSWVRTERDAGARSDDGPRAP